MSTIEQTAMRTPVAGQQAEQALIEQWIRPNPNKPWADEARLAKFHVPVYALVAYLDAVDGDVGRVARDYEVPREAVEAALAYYRRHAVLIDARIAANEPPE